jgi:hypothetical protein
VLGLNRIEVMCVYKLFFEELVTTAFRGSWWIPSTQTCKITIIALLLSGYKSLKTVVKSTILYERVGLQLRDQERFLGAIL